MSLVFHYADGGHAFDVDLGNQVVRLGDVTLTEIAGLGNAASSTITFDDPAGTLGHSSDNLLGLKSFYAIENTAPTNDQRIHTGYLGDRRYKRGTGTTSSSLITGVERVIECDVQELNACFGFNVIQPGDATGNRPAETPGARLTWLLASGYAFVSDHGLVVYPTTPVMDPADYRNQFPADVLNDICQATGFNFFAYMDDTVPAMALFFDDPNASTAYTSSLKLSNVLADLDTTTAASFLTGTTFAMDNVVITRSPNRVISGISIPYANQSLYLTRTATGTTYSPRDRIAPNANVKTAAMAKIQATRMLRENSTEDDRITCSVDVPAAKVNGIRSGHRIQATISFDPAYSSPTWFRVTQRTVKQAALTDQRYTLDLTLSPQVTVGSCGGYSLTPDGEYYPLGGNNSTNLGNPSEGVQIYTHSGLPQPSFPDPGWIGKWVFQQWGTGGIGTVDYAGDCVGNILKLVFVGNGTAVIHTAIFGGLTDYFDVTLGKVNSGVETYTVIATRQPAGVDYTVTVSDRSAPNNCIWYVALNNFTYGLSACGNKLGYAGTTWTSAP